MPYLYNGIVYTDEEMVDEAIREELSKYGYNNQDVPNEHVEDIWLNEVEKIYL